MIHAVCLHVPPLLCSMSLQLFAWSLALVWPSLLFAAQVCWSCHPRRSHRLLGNKNTCYKRLVSVLCGYWTVHERHPADKGGQACAEVISVCLCVWPPEETERRKEEGRLLHRGEKPLQTEEAGAQRRGGAHWCSGKLCSHLFRCAKRSLNFSAEFTITNCSESLEFIPYWTQADKRTPPRKKDLGKSGIKTSSLFKHNPDIPEILR